MDARKLDDATKTELHNLLGEELLKRLKAAPCPHCERGYVTHQELTVMRQFLSDNGVTAVARVGSPLRRVHDDLPFVDPTESVPTKETA
jgi:hypothetical protein